MKLKTYNRNTGMARLSSDPCISFQRTGTWLLNRALCELMGVQAGDRVSLHQDEEQPEDWYLSKDPQGIPLRKQSYKEQVLVLNGMGWRHALREALAKHTGEAVPETGRMMVAREAVVHGKVDLWPVITKSLTTTGKGRRRDPRSVMEEMVRAIQE